MDLDLAKYMYICTLQRLIVKSFLQSFSFSLIQEGQLSGTDKSICKKLVNTWLITQRTNPIGTDKAPFSSENC